LCASEPSFSAPDPQRSEIPPVLTTVPALALGLLLSFWKTPLTVKLVVLGLPLLLRRWMVMAGLLLGLLLGAWHLRKDRPFSFQGPEVISGKILKIEGSAPRIALYVETPSGKGEILARKVPPACRPASDLVAEVYPASQGYLNPFSGELRERLLSQGLRFRVRLKRDSDLECFPHPLRGLCAVRERLRLFSQKLSPNARGLFSALILGEKSYLQRDFRERIKELGLFHFLAVSGFHLGLLYALVFWLARISFSRLWPFSGIPVQIPAALAGLLGAGFYAALAGFPPSAERALTMLGLFTLSRLLFRRVSGWELLAGAVGILLLLRPEEVLSLSFRLSVAAVAGILTAHAILRGRLPRPRLLAWLLEGLVLSLGAWAFTLPLVLYYFGEAALFGPLNTLLALPLWTLILIPGELFAGLLALLWPKAALPLAEGLGRLATLFHAGPLPTLLFYPPWPVGLFSLAWTTLTASFLFWGSGRKRAAFLAGILFFFFSGLGWWARQRLFYLLVSDIGKANAVAVHLPGNRGILLDAGARFGDFDAGKYVLLPLLRKLGFPAPWVILSHPDLDHTGGLPALRRSYRLPKVLSGAFRPASWKPLGDLPRLEILKEPEVLSWGPGLLFLLPGRPYPPPRLENRESLVAFLEYQGLTVFFPGDADKIRLERLLEEGALLPSEIFVLPHHGAASGLFGPAWEALKPRAALASARGRKHPHPLVRRWLKEQGIPLYETARDGALLVLLRGPKVLVCPERRLRGGLPKELFWPYIPYVLPGKYCQVYGLHTLRNL